MGELAGFGRQAHEPNLPGHPSGSGRRAVSPQARLPLSRIRAGVERPISVGVAITRAQVVLALRGSDGAADR
jgi:hypothetical protein